MKHFLLRSLNRTAWIYPYLGLLYALYFIYFIAVPAYSSRGQLVRLNYQIFNVIFFFFFAQGYLYLICTRLSRIVISKLKTSSNDRYCNRCNSIMNERTFHCYLCQRCVPVRDHHCFFVGTCIGEHNLRYFILMLFHLFCAHCVGYSFVFHFMWQEIGGFSLKNFFRILFFNVGFLFGFIESKWEAWICFHHYLVFFDFVFIGKLFYELMKRSINGQTQYEEKNSIIREKRTVEQIFGCSNRLRLLFPIIPSFSQIIFSN